MSYFVLCFFALIFYLAPSSSQIASDNLFYSGFEAGDGATNLTLTGVAEIQKNGIIRLTNDTGRLMGHAFYSNPLRFKNSTNGRAFSFSTSFVFAIVPEYPKLGGHGLAFTIATSKDLKALPSQYLGLFNSSDLGNATNHVLAVEFDTVQDFEFGDINDNHVGLDINSLTSNASASAAYFSADGTKQDLNLKSGKSIQAWIDYDSVQGVLNVTISPFSSKPKSPILSFPVDLSPIVHEFMHIGFSSSTGLLASSHYIMGWSFKMKGQARELDLSSLPSLPGPKKNQTDLTIALSVSAVVLAVLAAVIAVCVVRKIRNAEVIEEWELDVGPHRYSYKELKKATKGFREKELLGQGGFGQVYKGTLPKSQTQVAVKRISHESKQGIREFVAEIASIGRLRHRNLVQLLGWCRRDGQLLLVYDFMANGSLDTFLFEEPKMVLNWEQRFKIIKDVAAGLLYLHEGYEQVVVHRDVKASNVLLDGELCGKLGDFGLARMHEHGSNPGTTRVVGTLGYLAPELSRTGKATTNSDVFAFGALLLEVTCGRRPIDPNARGDELVLVDWVWERFRSGNVFDVVDPRLNGEFDEAQVVMVVKLGLMCSNNGSAARPNMRQVVRYLDREAELPEELGGTREKAERDIDVEGFDDVLCSFASTSFDKNTCTFSEIGQVGVSFASLSTSPLSLLHTR